MPRSGWLAAGVVAGGLAAGAGAAGPAPVAPAPGGLVGAPALPPYPEVAPADLVRVEGTLRARPDGDYGRYLERIGVGATLGATRLIRLPAPAHPAATPAPPPGPAAGLAAGILIGLRDLVDRDLAADFTTSGISHVVAISGWNIAIVAATVGARGGRLSRGRECKRSSAAS